jgi:hypothetical protein
MTTAKILMLIVAVGGGCNSGFGQTWIPLTNGPSEHWVSVASSANGSNLIAIAQSWIYCTSTNSGFAWLTNTEPQKGSSYGSWNSIVSSADGTRLVATIAGSLIWISTNSGTTWTSNDVAGVSSWLSMASSADGNKLVGLSGYNTYGTIYNSTNGGMAWMPTRAPTNLWTCIASSADGNKLIAGTTGTGTLGGYVFVSTNSGYDWTLTSLPTNNSWASVASSADGTKLVAVSVAVIVGGGQFHGSVYTSVNSGTTWASNSLPNEEWGSVASSADGNSLVVVSEYPGYIYTTTNSGAAWLSNNAPVQVMYLDNSSPAVASSADGSKLVVAPFVANLSSDSPAPIYTSQTAPSPQLNITPSPTNLALSWIIPSTNFVLQQSPDLISWSSVTDTPPALNLTNLQNQVTLTPTNNIGFFRLSTP